MILFPAIDLKNGQCVRLKQGKFDDVTVYGNDPVYMAGQFAASGATHLHVVDLDGARTGNGINLAIIEEISARYPLFIQTGGGIRSLKDIETRINAGVNRVILGTAAIKNPEMVAEAVMLYGSGKIAVGVDADNGLVAVSGWEEISKKTALSLCLDMKKLGIETVVYTDIARDGMMSGFNIKSTKKLIQESGLNVIASGGIASMRDLEEAKEIGAYGAIIGQALYKGSIDLAKALGYFERGER